MSDDDDKRPAIIKIAGDTKRMTIKGNVSAGDGPFLDLSGSSHEDDSISNNIHYQPGKKVVVAHTHWSEVYVIGVSIGVTVWWITKIIG